MTINLEKFGTTLTSREAGKEAFASFLPTLNAIQNNEDLEINFDGVLTLSPGWADEFLSPLLNERGDRLILLPSDNLSVQATLRTLQEVNKRKFNTSH